MAYEDEAGLITKILEEQDIRTSIKLNVTPYFFQDIECREIYQWILERFQQYGRTPSLRLIERNFPNFELLDSDEDIIELIAEVKRSKLHSDIAIALKEVKQALLEDPEVGLEKYRETAGRLTLTHSNTEDLDITKDTEEIWDEFETARSGEGVMGIPYPWPYLNQVTLGMHRGELIGIYARPKSMKTWLAIVIANHIHKQGKVLAFFSGEMPVRQIRRRLAALRADLPYAGFRSGRLDKKQTIRFKRALAELKKSPPFMICKIGGTGDSAITEVRAKCEEYGVDIAICDGIYFWMEDDSHHSFRTITRGLKKAIAEPLNIPVIGITQANRSSEQSKGRGTTGVAFGDSMAQDCDQLIHIIREQQHTEQQELLITMPAMREAAGGTFTINAIPANNFTQKAVHEDQHEILDDTDEGAIIVTGAGE
jgi:replicative DNA helicase